MTDMNDLSPNALKAALVGGTASWGTWGSAADHHRYIESTPNKRRRCHCGCKGAVTHRGMANGVCLTSGCELSMRRWVRDPYADLRRKHRERLDAAARPGLDGAGRIHRGTPWSTEQEAAAKKAYETFKFLPGYVPWVDGGNSDKQDEARDLVRKAVRPGPDGTGE